MNILQVVLEKIFMDNFLLSQEITSAFTKLLGNCSWVLGQCNNVVIVKLSNINNILVSN
jgi:hypothetical protein